MEFITVPPDLVSRVWPHVSKLLDRALIGVDEYGIDDLLQMVESGSHELVICMEGGVIVFALTFVIDEYPNETVLFITSMGSPKWAEKHTVFEAFRRWCAGRGCTKLQGFCRESVYRLVKTKFGASSRRRVVEFDL